MVYNIRHVITDHFDIYFHIWRDGGADLRREKLAWEVEEEQQ